MKRSLMRLRATVLSVPILLLCVAAPEPGQQPAAIDRIRFGMTPDEVRLALGPPHHVARQILYHRHLEQWVYNLPISLRLDFDCPRGQVARLVAFESTAETRRP
jgi:hypothetical protein